MTLIVAALLAFLALYVVDRLYTVFAVVRPVLATAVAVGVGLGLGADARELVTWFAGGALGLILSEVVAMLQAATDALRVRVIAAATRRGRIPPI